MKFSSWLSSTIIFGQLTIKLAIIFTILTLYKIVLKQPLWSYTLLRYCYETEEIQIINSLSHD